jgi:hypothetical protein
MEKLDTMTKLKHVPSPQPDNDLCEKGYNPDDLK